MSFDLRIEANDLLIGANGDLAIVQDNEKLAQDVIKGVLTPLGSNRFFRWYGTTIGIKTIGQVLDASILEMEAQRSVEDLLNNIIKLQKVQAREQYVSPGETIASVRDISVLRNQEDPRQYEVKVSLITRQLTEVNEVFALRV